MSARRPTLLIVDDDVALATAFSRALERAGFETRMTSGSSAVVDLIESNRPDALLMDNHMPGTSGIELIALIRRRWDADELPIVLISGSSVQGEIDRAMAAGANGFRRKPIELPELIRTVQSMVGQDEPPAAVESGVNR